MKLIIAGSRNINLSVEEVDNYLKKLGLEPSEIVCGMAKGVDLSGLDWAKNKGVDWKKFPAPWDDIEGKPSHLIGITRWGKKYYKAAGPDRNKQMAEYADCLLCIHNGSSGSLNMMQNMIALNKPYHEIKI